MVERLQYISYLNCNLSIVKYTSSFCLGCRRYNAFDSFIFYKYRSVSDWIKTFGWMFVALIISRYAASCIWHDQICCITICPKHHITSMVSNICVSMSNNIVYQLLTFLFGIRSWFCLQGRYFINCWQYSAIDCPCIVQKASSDRLDGFDARLRKKVLMGSRSQLLLSFLAILY